MQYVGPTDFTDGVSNDIMLEADIDQDGLRALDEDLEQRRSLIESFLEAVSRHLPKVVLSSRD